MKKIETYETQRQDGILLNANEMSDDFLVCKAEVLLWSSYCGIGKDIFEYNFCNEVDMKIPERAKKFGFTNFLAYLYVFGFENDRDSVREIALNENVNNSVDIIIHFAGLINLLLARIH